MADKYGPIHAEAEAYFARLISGRSLADDAIERIALGVALVSFEASRRQGTFAANDLKGDIAARASDLPGATAADLEAILQRSTTLRHEHEAAFIVSTQEQLDQHRVILKTKAPEAMARTAFTLKDAYAQVWVPSKDRGKNTVVEIGRYVDEFEALNGKLDLREYTREHWAAWRADCLDRHGPGATAFKRFSMMKTICNEAIRAGLFERKNFAGQDVSMRKIKGKKLRNDGWRSEELKAWFTSPIFQGVKEGPHPDADYWSSVIIAYTGAAIIEVANMNTSDVQQREGYWTMRLWRDKSAHSDRIIPIPQQVLDLGFLRYVETRPKAGPMFAKANGKRVGNKDMSQRFTRMRADIGIARTGATAHTYRHHIKTVLAGVGAPERVNDYITGHAPPNVGRTYGKVEFETARQYLDKVDLGVIIPKWTSK